MNLMGFFRSLFPSRKRPQLTPMRQCSQVYFSLNGIFVCAIHRTVDGMTPCGRPMILLPHDASSRQIGRSTLASLRESRDGLSAEEFESTMAEALRTINESSWDYVEKRWELIGICVESDSTTVEIHQYHRVKRGGYVLTSRDSAIRCESDEERVGCIIREIVDSQAHD